jgi:hypothetical protein
MIRLLILRAWLWLIESDIAQVEYQITNAYAAKVDYLRMRADVQGRIARQEIAMGRMPSC